MLPVKLGALLAALSTTITAAPALQARNAAAANYKIKCNFLHDLTRDDHEVCINALLGNEWRGDDPLKNEITGHLCNSGTLYVSALRLDRVNPAMIECYGVSLVVEHILDYCGMNGGEHCVPIPGLKTGEEVASTCSGSASSMDDSNFVIHVNDWWVDAA